MAQVLEHLLSKQKALSSNPSAVSPAQKMQMCICISVCLSIQGQYIVGKYEYVLLYFQKKMS
jgi:hypothetical protein